jgi:hypothetical protein
VASTRSGSTSIAPSVCGAALEPGHEHVHGHGQQHEQQRQRREQRLVQAFVAQAAIEALNEAVLHWLARRDVVPLDAPFLRPAQDG